MKSTCLFSAVIIIFLSAGCSINKDYRIIDGQTSSGNLTSINGGIYIGIGANVLGGCRTINGSIDVGNRSTVRSIESVNGKIKIGREVSINGDVKTINSRITAKPGTIIVGDVNTINGNIILEGTYVCKNVNTYNGDISLYGDTVVKGDIVIEGNYNSSQDRPKVRIEITDNSIVNGNIKVDDEKIDVTVYLSHSGKVEGRIDGAYVEKRKNSKR
jgi:hypothetical protein